jgi:hypothetical protein
MAPPEGPLRVPKTRPVLSLPENTRRIDLGFPPPSHPHLNHRVPTRNEELPRPQLDPDDFRNVLRKKHAVDRHFPAGMSVPKAVNSPCRSIDYRFRRVKSRAATFFRQSGPILRQSAASRFLGRSGTEACFYAFCSFIGNDWRHAFGDTCFAFTPSRLVALNPLSFVGAVRNDDAKPLDSFAAVGKAYL